MEQTFNYQPMIAFAFTWTFFFVLVSPVLFFIVHLLAVGYSKLSGKKVKLIIKLLITVSLILMTLGVMIFQHKLHIEKMEKQKKEFNRQVRFPSPGLHPTSSAKHGSSIHLERV